MEFYKSTKSALGLLEIGFFRLFPPLSIIGAAALGEATFMGSYAFYFFLVLPVIDVTRCILYWRKTYENDSPEKQYWNRFFYTLKALANVIASTLIVLANSFGMDALLVPGEALFISAIVGFTAIQYLIKAFGGLSNDDNSEKDGRTFKNGLLAATLFAVCAGLALLYFYPEIELSHEPLGWFLLVMANALPVVGFALKYNDKWYVGASVLLLTGLALLISSPKLSTGLDAAYHTEVGVGLAFVLAGFTLAMTWDIYLWDKRRKTEEEKFMPNQQESLIRTLSNNTNNPEKENKPSSLIRFFKSCLPCVGTWSPSKRNTT